MYLCNKQPANTAYRRQHQITHYCRKLAKQTTGLFFILLLMASCRKSNSDPQKTLNNNTVAATNVSYKVNKAGYEAYMKAAATGRKSAIDSVLTMFAEQQAAGKLATADDVAAISDAETVSYEIVSSSGSGQTDALEFYTPNSYVYDYEDWVYYDTYNDVVKMQLTFNMRGNVLFLYVPFEFWWRNGRAGSVKKPDINPTGTSYMNIVGPRLGDLSLGYYYWNIYNSAPYTANPVTGDVDATMNETRTVLKDQSSNIKLVAGVEGDGLSVGSEMSDGFKIASKYYTNSNYNVKGYYTINCLPPPNLPLKTSSISGVCAGIQHN